VAGPGIPVFEEKPSGTADGEKEKYGKQTFAEGESHLSSFALHYSFINGCKLQLSVEARIII
jgi:hypothetical protein